MGISEKYIRAMLEKGRISYSDHAQKRMGERMIPRELVDQAILHGSVIETQDFPDKNIHVVFQSLGEKEEIYAIVAADFPQVVVVTVCYFIEDMWEQLGAIHKRRMKK